jgi:hypothetical protein
MTVCDLEVFDRVDDTCRKPRHREGLRSVWLDALQARGFYEAVGYELFGMLDNYPAGQKRYFLRKRLIP